MAIQSINILKAINHSLDLAMAKDPRVVVFGEDVGVEGGVFRATEGLQKTHGADRCFDTPLAESAIVGTAIGMAINGLRPVVEMQFDGFIWPAMNQIVSHAARMRNRTRGTFHVPLVIRVPYGAGIRALEHHSESNETFFAHVPGLKVVIPSTPYDAKGLLLAAIEDEDPVLYFEPKRLYRAFRQEVPEEYYTLPIGKSACLQEGSQITVVSWGAQLQEVRQAVSQAGEKGISVELFDLRTLSPIDLDPILDSVRKTGRFLVVHEAPRMFGPGGELVSTVTEEAFLHLEAPPTRLANFSVTPPLARGEHHFMIPVARVVDQIEALVNY
jgi:pyruvate dehydrogenase E1 component beta subunit